MGNAAASQSVTTGAATVEIIGLRHWSVSMLVDSLQKHRPDVTLGDAACAAVLRDDLGFPDASVLRFRDGRVILTVIEPGDSGRVVLRPPPDGTETPTGPWLRLRELQDSSGFAVDYALDTYLRHAAGTTISVEPADTAVVRHVWTLLGQSRDGVDWHAALTALTRSAEPAVRRAAASYLVRYPEHDSTWYALVHALRDPDWSVRTNTIGTLRTFRETAARPLDWRPAVADLRHLLDGTTLVFHTEVVKLLLATAVAPELNSSLLSPPGVRLLRAQVAANHEYVRIPASDLLRRLSGIDPQGDPTGFEQWVQRTVNAPRGG
jgi:hypothetical protein